MPLTRQTVIDDIRATNPELFEDWTDESLYSYARQDIPDLNQLDVSPGKAAYEAYGAAEAPGFIERATNQFESQIQETKVGMYGLLPWTETEAYENQRIYNNSLYLEKIANNQSLQALTAWKEDEPGWTNLHTASRALSEAIPSLAISMATTLPAVLLAPSTGGGSLALAVATLAPMFAMEAGAQMNEAMTVLVDDLGLDPDEAREYAATTAVAYGTISSLLERVGAKHYLKIAGISKKTSESLLRRTLAQRIVDTGLSSGKMVRLGLRGAAGVAKGLEGAMMEGTTETMQAYIQNTINRGLELNLGKDQLSVQDALSKAFKETWSNPAVWEEGFAGATTGILGVPAGVATKTAASRATESEIVETIKDSKLDVPIDESTPPGQAPPSSPVGSFSSRYIDALANIDDLNVLPDLMDDIKDLQESSPEAKKIQEIENTEQVSVSVGKKLLQFVKGNTGRIQDIESSPNKERLVNEMFKEILKTSIGKTLKKDLTTDNKLKIIKDFALTGKIIKGSESNDFGSKTTIDIEYDSANIAELGFQEKQPGQGTLGKPDPSTLEGSGATKVKKEYIKKNRVTLGSLKANLALLKKQKAALPKTANFVKINEMIGKVESEIKVLAKEEVDEYIAPIERVQFPSAKSINDAVAIVDDVEVQLTKVQKKKLLSIKKLKNSAVLSDQGQAEVQLLELGRSLIEKHGKAEQKQATEEAGGIDDDIIMRTDSKAFPIAEELKEGKTDLLLENKEWAAENREELEFALQDPPKETFAVRSGAQKLPKKEVARQALNQQKLLNARALLDSIIPVTTSPLTQEDKKLESKPFVQQIIKAMTKPMTAFEIATAIGFPRDKMYYHLKKLFKAKLIYHAGSDIINGIERKRFLPTIRKESSIPIAPPELTEGIEFPTETAPSDTPSDVLSRLESGEDASGGDLGQAMDDEAARDEYLASVASTPQVDEKQDAKDEKKLKTPAQKRREIKKNKSAKNIETDSDLNAFQDKDSSVLPYLKDEPEFVERLINRLKKHFPDIDTATFEGLIEDEGISAIGMAIEGMVAWSTTDGRLDTIPHEYAHIYIKMFKDQAIVKKGIKEFETEDGNGEENLVLAIGKYYVDRMKNEPKKLRLRFGKWLKQFVARMKRMFGFEPSQKQEIMEFIAEELYQGRWLAVSMDSVTPFKDYMANEVESDNDAALQETTDGEMNEEMSGNLNKTNAMSSVDAYHSFYHKIFGIVLNKEKDFPKLKNLEKENNNFEDYLDSLYTVLDKIIKTRSYDDDRNFKSKESLTSEELRKLKQEWVKGRRRMTRFNEKNKDVGPDSRLYFRIIKNRNEKTGEKKTSELSMEVADELDRVRDTLHPRHLSGNKIEQDFEEGRNKIRLGILPIKQIMTYVFNKGNSFYKTSANEISLESLKEMQINNETRYKNKLLKGIAKIKKIANRELVAGESIEGVKANVIEGLKALNPQLITINATKFGDNAAIIASVVQDENPHQITLESFKNRVDEELERGNITQSQYDLMIEESNYLDLESDPDDFLSFTLSEYIDNWMQENPNGKINDLLQVLTEGADSIADKDSLATQLQQLTFWQGARTPDYFRYERSAADSMIRLSIDMAEGGSPVGLRDFKMMILPEGATVTGQIPKRDSNGKVMTDSNDNVIFIQSEEISYDLFDGASINGTQWLKELGENIGYNKFQQIKTFIRDRTINKDGSVDYLGMKHMQFAGFKGMIIKDKDGYPIAQMFQNPKTKLTYWATIDGDGNILEKFDQVSSTNEAKMTYGKYASLKQKKDAFPEDESKHTEGHGVVHSIKSSSIIINQVQEKSKSSGSFPIAFGDLLIGISNEDGNVPVEIQNVLSKIRSRYLEVSNHYTKQINGFYKNPETLYAFVKKARAEGELISELEEWIDIVGEDGMGLQHPAIMTHLLPAINSKLIKDALNKGRAFEGTSSQLYIKPSFNGTDSKTNNQHVLKGNVIISSDNSIAFNQVLKRWLGSSESNQEILKKLNLKDGKDRHTLINTYLNPFLEENSIYVLMHRNPISKVTNPIARKVQALEEGHGESMLLTHDDVKKIFDGDWDGDKGNFEFVTGEFAKDLLSWQKYSVDNNLNRTVSLPPFGARVDSFDSNEKSTALSVVEDTKTEDESSDTLKEIARNASNSGSTGVTMNARTILAQLFSKKLKIEMKIQIGAESIEGVVSIADPNSEVVLDYIQIDKKMMNKAEIDILKENGDTIVNNKGKEIDFKDIKKSKEELYLKTIKSHEMAILFQMAVDGSKFTHLADILQKSDSSILDFMLSRMFVKQLANGKPLKTPFTIEELALLKQVYTAQNYSAQRQGKTRTRISANFDTNLAFSSELNQMINGDEEISDQDLQAFSPKGLASDADYSASFTKKMKTNMGKGYKGVKNFLLSLENNISPMESLLIGLDKKIDSEYLSSFSDPTIKKLSHIRAVTEIMNSPSVSKFMDKMLVDDDSQKTYDNAENFLYEEKIYIEAGEGKLSDAFESNKKVKEASYSFIDVWNKLLESTKDREQIQADKNLMFAEFIDRFMPKYQTLSKFEQQWVTVRFITGSLKGSEIYLQKLLPKAFLNNPIMQTYLKSYETQLRENYLGKADLVLPTPEVQRRVQAREGGFNYVKNQVIAKRNEARVKNNQETLEERSKCNV